MTLKQATLWSFLTQSSAKREIVCPDALRVSIEDFALELKSRLAANRLPAEAELTDVNWDDTDRRQRLILIRYTGTQAATNILQFAVGLEQLGNFAYLEKKVYLVPPQLPERLQMKTPDNPLEFYEHKKNDGCGWTGLLLIAGVGALAMMIVFVLQADMMNGSLWLVPAIVLLIWGAKRSVAIEEANKIIDGQNAEVSEKNMIIENKNVEIRKWNQRKQQIDNDWKQIFDRWHKDTLEVAYLAQTTDVFGRWTSAVSTTIDQVVQKLFIERHAQAQQWDEEQRSKAQLEQVLKDRYNEVF